MEEGDEEFLPLEPLAVKNVSVNVNAAGTALAADPDVLHMGTGRFQRIEWTIETAGWVFPTFRAGIQLKQYDDDLTNGSVDPSNRTVFRMNNANRRRRDLPYTVRVVKADGSVTLELDPTIKNQA